ncbi:methyltransferase domain-containing protein [Irpex rosettiformis]|uniref:Methyltransferase domain-containing protein n=1 Tax=Irpex rosettiformis TaxID=378272 RepID=A0ACB8U131_9APHY|nr:methyltransferase domain-containing protein [Irpex rosettiformis]
MPQITGKFVDYFPQKFRGSTSLRQFLEQEEAEYQLVLAGRQEMINYYGPDPKDVQSWPPGNIFYVLWDFYIASFNCPHRIQRVGNLGDGGKWLCGVERIAAQRKPCNVYSFGVNHDSSFEAAFLQRAPNCQIWGYDFSVHEWGPQIQTVPEFLEASHFFPYKAAAEDKPHLTPPEYTIQTIMQNNGHEFIDLLKIDIEGGEFSVLESFLRPYAQPDSPPLPVGQLEIEIHAWGAYTNFDVFNPWWELLEKAGFRPFWTEANLPKVSHLKSLPDTAEYSFINIRGRHAVISDYY